MMLVTNSKNILKKINARGNIDETELWIVLQQAIPDVDDMVLRVHKQLWQYQIYFVDIGFIVEFQIK